MAMSMQEVFYGESEPAYFVQYGRQFSSPFAHAYQMPPPVELNTFDLMVPMCCARCEDQVRDALYAMRSVRDVHCDGRNQLVTVTGCLDRAQALKQVRRVKSDATFWSSSYSARRYEVSSHPKSYRYVQEDNSRSYVVREQRSLPDQYSNRSSSDEYSRSLCPAYRDSTETHYISVNPTIATRVEIDC